MNKHHQPMTIAMRIVCALLLLVAGEAVLAQRVTTYYHTDGQGSVVAASDAAGSLLWRKSYKPYGEQIDNYNEREQLSYTSKQHDDISRFTYFGARYYDPELGRFLSTDAVQFVEENPMSFNRYGYAYNNPYKYVDPDGNLPVLIPIVIFIAKEAAAEVASHYTGGATDFLSVRRMGTKGAKFALRKLSAHIDEAKVATGRKAAPLPAGESPYQLKLFPDEAYDRTRHYGDTPTAAQRASVPSGMSFDHDPPLVKQYYEGVNGGLPGYNLTATERLDLARSLKGGAATLKQQRAQGAATAAYSKQQKRIWGLDQ